MHYIEQKWMSKPV